LTGGSGERLIHQHRHITHKLDLIAIGCLIGAIVCWGVPPIMLRYLRHFVPDGFTANFIRYPIATIVYLPLVINYARKHGLGSFWWTALLPTFVNIVGQTLFAIAPYHLEAGMMSFLLRLSIVWSILGAFCLFRDERRLAGSGMFWTGTILSVAGFVFMSWAGSNLASVTSRGILIALVCSIFWGFYDVTVRLTMRDLNPLVVFGVIGNYSSIGFLLLGPLGEPRSLLHLEPKIMALLIISAYIGICLAHGMYYVAIQRLGVAVSANTMMVTPFVSILGAAIFLGERFSAMQWLGGMTLIAGATLALWSRQRIGRLPPAPLEISPD